MVGAIAVALLTSTFSSDSGAMEQAICSGDKAAVAKLLVSGVSPNSTINSVPGRDVQDSLLSIAVREEQLEIAKLLIENGASVNGVKAEHEHPLWWAARSGRLELVKELVSHGAELDAQRSGNGTTALHAAIYFDHPRVVRYLVDRGADSTKKTLQHNPWGIYDATPLELARRLKHAECEKMIQRR